MGENRRLLIYSHDSFGLGHLRRCRTIAHALVERFSDLSVIILSGSPIVGSFDYRARVDFIRVPGVIKLRNGEYTPLQLHIDIEQTLAIRSSIIRHTAEVFAPHMFIVDKEPLGLRGEVEPTLRYLRSRGVRCVLGLRDVMDEPRLLLREWRRKGVARALRALYDEIWIYGLPEIFDFVAELPGMARIAYKLRYTGYLRRDVPRNEVLSEIEPPQEPYVLVTTGGGGDGADLIDWVISAYEHDPSIPYAAVLVLGPFMDLEARRRFQERAAGIPRLKVLTFDARIERLFAAAAGVVAMGGYNTFCEILSFDRPALVVPRTVPRREQALRIERAARLGMLELLPDDGIRDPRVMAARLHELPRWKRPGAARAARFLTGLDRIAELASPWLEAEASQAAVAGLG